MGHTNSTANLSLPQFIGSDKPTWLGDINGAFSDIDAYVGTNDAAVSAAASDASSAVAQAASAVSTANAANTTAGNASTAATNAVGTANNAMSLVNQTNVKIGTLADLTTTDKTSIVNAINEVNGAIGTPSAAQVSYDNSGSGLSATNVQDAIDEVAQGGGLGAWTQIGQETGTTAIATPSGVSEICAIVKPPTGYSGIFNIPAIRLSATTEIFGTGRYATASLNNACTIQADTSEIKIYKVYENGSEVTASSVITVYAR